MERISHTRARALALAAVLLTLPAQLATAAPQQADTAAADTTAATFGSGGSGVFLWDLIGEAGGFQYPIFFVFIVGLFLIFAKVYELFTDRREAQELEDAPLADMNLKRITMTVANQRESMLAELQATMLNVFQTSKDAATLHEEIANFIQFQRERFDTFKRRVDFLSDTAGALGLLGTVWGMFTVFSSGNTSDKEVVLLGMGTALISTALGLIASIILNLSSTEVYSFFDRRIDQIEDKADELRFRLMELVMHENGAASPAPAPVQQAAAPAVATSAPSADGQAAAPTETVAAAPSSSQPAPAAEAPAPSSGDGSDAGVVAAPEPEQLDVAQLPARAPVATTTRAIVRVTDAQDQPVPEAAVQVRVQGEGGQVAGEKTATLATDADGQAAFDWQLPGTAGVHTVAVRVPEASGDLSRTLSVTAEPGPPEQLAHSGNNQGAEVGHALPKPLRVRMQDAHDNPVPDHPVQFEVEMGSGTFENGSQSITLPTNDDGIAAAAFTVGDEPGFNTILAQVGEKEIKFQAMGLEG